MIGTVLSTLTEGVRMITLNRPERLNAMNCTLVSETLIAFKEANADPETRAVVVRGAGRAFCSGDDLKDQFEAGQRDEREVRAFCEEIQDITREIVIGDNMVVGATYAA